MTEQQSTKKTYESPSMKRWGTVLDLTAGGETGGSGDTYECPSSVIPEGNNTDLCD